jgi:hypothetical protein
MCPEFLFLDLDSNVFPPVLRNVTFTNFLLCLSYMLSEQQPDMLQPNTAVL